MDPIRMAHRASFRADIGATYKARKILLNCHPVLVAATMHPMVTTAAGMAAKAMAARRNWRNLWWGREAIVRFRMKEQF